MDRVAERRGPTLGELEAALRERRRIEFLTQQQRERLLQLERKIQGDE